MRTRFQIFAALGLLWFISFCGSTQSVAASALVPAQLRCEYLENPRGLETTHPRLSWILESTGGSESAPRSQTQTAYRILVASSEALLNQNKGDLWDSGKVESDESVFIPYAGKPLISGTQCFWKVRIWSHHDGVSRWSDPASWSMGLPGASEWTAARWIGEDKRASGLDSEGYQWIWYPEGKPNEVAPYCTRYFRHFIQIPEGRKITSAIFHLTCDNGFTLFVNGHDKGTGTNWSLPPKLDIRDVLKPGANLLAIAATNDGSAAGLVGRLTVEFDDHTSLVLGLDETWKTSNQLDENWQSASFDDRSWMPSMVLGPMGMAPWGGIQWNDGVRKWVLPPSPFLRHVFNAPKTIRRATLYAMALGTYELHLNGRRVGSDYFNPGWTEFRRRVYYQTYDVTSLLHPGDNAMGAILSDGWYSGYIWAGRDTYGNVPKLCLQLRVDYTDGTHENIVTDSSWKLAYGPIREGDVQQGETYDARLEMPGWDTASFNDSQWKAVTVSSVTNLEIGVSPAAPVRKQAELSAVKMTEPKPGVYVFDLGQNISGWARIHVAGPRGTKVTLRYSGWLNPDGTIYTDYLRECRGIDAYILKGDGRETWEPSTTYHGFQYVELTGLAGKPSLEDLKGIVCYSTLPVTGTFECSDPRVNRLYSNALWSILGNLVDLPTGCADRAERLGWCAKSPLVTTWTYTADMGGFLSKWMVDLVDSQSQSESKNAFTQVAPFWGDIESPGWSDDGISVPYGLYKAYGDKGIIVKHYDAMKRYIGYLEGKLVKDLRPADLGLTTAKGFTGYGDWLGINQDRDKDADIFNTLLNGYSVHMVAEMAEAIGRTEDAAHDRALFERMKTAFNKAYVSDKGEIRDKKQTQYALALYMGFLPDNKISAAMDYLADDIQHKSHQQIFPDAQNKNPIIPEGHLTTGFHGSRALLPVLSRYGRNDLAYDLLLLDSYPSWLYPVKLGATTTWERWDGWTPDRGFQNPAMNSFNMPDLMASVCEWLFADVAGINTIGPGFHKILIQPRIGAGLSWAAANYRSIHGMISVRWEKKPDQLALDVTVPPNTTAAIRIPAADSKNAVVNESGRTVWYQGQFKKGGSGISGGTATSDGIEFSAGSGHYHFELISESK